MLRDVDLSRLPTGGAGNTIPYAADRVASGLAAPAELPVGVVTALLGAPFFLWPLRRRGAA